MLLVYRYILRLAAALVLALAGTTVVADPSGSARTDAPSAGAIRGHGTGLEVVLALAAPGPFRARMLDGPPRLAIDIDRGMLADDLSLGFRIHSLTDGRLRIEAAVPTPMAIDRATMSVRPGGQGASLALRLRRVASADFPARTGKGDTSLIRAVAAPAPQGLVIALDPGHGGHDPGATHGVLHEADLVLEFARVLKADLLRTTAFDVVLTRDDDRFVPLERRRALARLAGADVFLSIHADGLEQGSASGATVFTHAARPAPVDAGKALAEALRRDGMLAVSDPASIAPAATAYRSRALATALVRAIDSVGLPLYKHPRQEADFVVLRDHGMASVLVELGFLTEAQDRARIADPAWRSRMAAALRRGVVDWASQNARLAALAPQ